MVTVLVTLATAIMPMLSASVLTLSPSLVAKLATIGGTGGPTAEGMEYTAGGSFIDGRTVEAIYTPQQFWPAYGQMTLAESVSAGTDNVLAWAAVETDQDVTFLTVSQGSVVLSQVIAHWNSDPANAPPADQFKFVLLANPQRPNGGALARLPGLSLFGVTFYGPTEQSQYQVIDSAFAYDLFATAPMYLNNPLSLLNAFAGVAFPYNGGNSLHGTDPDYTNPDLDVRTEVYGNTTYHTIIPKNLPMLEPLRMVGLGAFADVIQPLLKVWVDAGYYKNDPAASPGVHMPAELFMPLDNIIRALAQTPGAILEGLATIPQNLGIDRRQPQPSLTEEPPADDGANQNDDNRMMLASTHSSPDNKEGDEITNDSSMPEAPVTTGGQDGGSSTELPDASPPAATIEQQGNSDQGEPGEKSSEPLSKELPREEQKDGESSGSLKDESNKEEDDKVESERKSEIKNDDFGHGTKKDDEESAGSQEPKSTKSPKSEPPSSRKGTVGVNNDDSSESSADKKDSDTANAA